MQIMTSESFRESYTIPETYDKSVQSKIVTK